MKTRIITNNDLPVGILALPTALFIAELFIRGSDILHWSISQWSMYLLSILLSLCMWLLFFYLSCSIYRLNKFLGYSFVFIVFTVEISLLILSYGYYFYFHRIPNYYLIEFLIQEPKDFYSGVTDTITIWHFAALAVFTLLVSFYWIRYLQNHIHRKITARVVISVLTALVLSLIAFQRIDRYDDQSIMPDFNSLYFSSRLTANYLILKKPVSSVALHPSRRFRLSPVSRKTNVNILLILNESLRRKSLPFYGYPRHITPHLSHFFNNHPDETFVFKKSYATSTFTMLSVPSILTGVSPVQPGQVLHTMPLLFDYARAMDYRTFFISSQSFAWRHLDRFFKTAQIDYFWNKEIGKAPRVHDIGTDDRLMIQEWKQVIEKIGSQPFVGVIQTYYNHYPYFAPRQIKKLPQRYEFSITCLDSIMGDVLSELSQRNLLENTIIIFTSDHGEAFGEHGYYGHLRTFYEEESGIPFVIYVPRKIQQLYGNQIEILRENTFRNITFLDALPTILDFLKYTNLPDKIRNHLPGQSLLRPVNPNRTFYMLNNNEVSNYRVFISIGVLKGDYKYLLLNDGTGFREEYYHLPTDPAESENLFQLFPQQIEMIHSELQQIPPTRRILITAGIRRPGLHIAE